MLQETWPLDFQAKYCSTTRIPSLSITGRHPRPTGSLVGGGGYPSAEVQSAYSTAPADRAVSWWKCHWPDLKSAGLFPRNLFLNSLKTSTLTLWPINSGLLTSLILPHLSSSLKDSLPSLNLLCYSKTEARFIQDAPKAVWSIPYVSMAFFPSLKQNFIAYRSSKVSDCIFEIHQLWKSGFSRVYSNCFCSCSFEPEIIKIRQSSHKVYSNYILNFQESTTILNACTKSLRQF